VLLFGINLLTQEWKMKVFASPLRYPGGKASLYTLMSKIIRLNGLDLNHYAEPYAGGCGLALNLLYGGVVSEIHINDIDPGIWSFWKSVLDHTEELIHLIEKTDVNIAEWHKQREIQLSEDVSNPLSLGFSTFFLNRTNRSGIIQSAGVIGGMDQTGNYKIDCRFNCDSLIRRIRRVRKYRSRVHLYNFDAIEFMSDTNLPTKTFLCIDPPYFNKGSSLYTSFYEPSDHSDVADTVLQLNNPWVVTYDNVQPIQELYKSRRQFTFDINYSVQTKRVGTELLIASKGLRLPKDIRARQSIPSRKSITSLSA